MWAACRREIWSASGVWAPELSSTILGMLSLYRQELGRSGLILGIVLGTRSIEIRNVKPFHAYLEIQPNSGFVLQIQKLDELLT